MWRETTSVVCTATLRRAGPKAADALSLLVVVELALRLGLLPCVRKMRRKNALPPPWAKEDSLKCSPWRER